MSHSLILFYSGNPGPPVFHSNKSVHSENGCFLLISPSFQIYLKSFLLFPRYLLESLVLPSDQCDSFSSKYWFILLWVRYCGGPRILSNKMSPCVACPPRVYSLRKNRCSVLMAVHWKFKLCSVEWS